MSLFEKLRQALGSNAPNRAASNLYEVSVRCRRCGEILTAHINLLNDLSLADDVESYRVRKLITGSGENRCFERVEVLLTFDQHRQLLSREAIGGTFVDEASDPHNTDV